MTANYQSALVGTISTALICHPLHSAHTFPTLDKHISSDRMTPLPLPQAVQAFQAHRHNMQLKMEMHNDHIILANSRNSTVNCFSSLGYKRTVLKG